MNGVYPKHSIIMKAYHVGGRRKQGVLRFLMSVLLIRSLRTTFTLCGLTEHGSKNLSMRRWVKGLYVGFSTHTHVYLSYTGCQQPNMYSLEQNKRSLLVII